MLVLGYPHVGTSHSVVICAVNSFFFVGVVEEGRKGKENKNLSSFSFFSFAFSPCSFHSSSVVLDRWSLTRRFPVFLTLSLPPFPLPLSFLYFCLKLISESGAFKKIPEEKSCIAFGGRCIVDSEDVSNYVNNSLLQASNFHH